MQTLYSSMETPTEFDLRNSFGGYLCVGNNQFILDAGLGPSLGYNASAYFGTVQNVDAWLDNKSSENWKMLCNASDHLRSRQIGRHNNITLLARESEAAWFQHFYIENSILDQFQNEVKRVEELCRKQLKILAQRFEIFEVMEVDDPWRQLEIWLRFPDRKQFDAFCEKRFLYGLHFLAFEKQSRFTVSLNLKLSLRNQDIELLVQQIERLLLNVSGQQSSFPSAEISLPGSAEQNYRFAELMIESRLDSRPGVPDDGSILDYVQSALPPGNFEVAILDAESYPRFRPGILDMQQDVYEPARQSPPEEFDAIFESEKPVAIVVHRAEKIVAMGLAGPISHFRGVRGFENDPYRNSDDVLYMVDVTVSPDFRGGMGRIIKNSIALLGLQQGYSAIHGRNRDQLARGMWAINLSLGSFEMQHLVNDYPDDGEHRDCFYYRCPIAWLTRPNMTMDEVRQRLPVLVNGGQPELATH